MDVPNLILKRCPTPNSLLKKKYFFKYPFFYYDFWKLVKKSLLVDLLTFVAIKKKNNDIYLKITKSAV